MSRKKFLFSKKNYLGQMSSYVTRTQKQYIYVLFTSAEKQNYPYYVGTTLNFDEDFTDNPEVLWHLDTFGKPAVVHVVASHPDAVAETSYVSLVKMLTNEGHVLHSHDLTRSFPVDGSGASFDKVIREWSLMWKKAVHSAPAASGDFNKRDIQQTVFNRTYNIQEAKALSLKLAKAYNYATNSSTINVPFVDDAKKMEDMFKAIKHLNGDWYLTENSAVGQRMSFHMSDSLKAAVKAVVKKRLK